MKKYLMAPCILLMASLLSELASAQHNHPPPQQRAVQLMDSTRQMGGMEGGMMAMMHDMMGTMMSDPIRRSGLLIHILPTMKEPLKLTDDQLAGLQAARTTYQNEFLALEEKARNAENELQELWQSEEADPAAVKPLLLAAAEHRAGMKALTYETAANMRSLLSEEQRTALDELTPAQLHDHMMTNMTMMEMMKVMHDGSMMQGGMMQGGMMQGGMMQGGMMQMRRNQ